MYRSFAIAVMVGVAVGRASLALADEHRTSNVPTQWWWQNGATTSDISALIGEDARLIDLEVQSANPLTFTTSYVKDQGVYQAIWWAYFGQTPQDVAGLLNTNQARLIDIERYETGGGPAYAVIMVDDTGPNQKNWWWYVDITLNDLITNLSGNSARLVDIESYDDGPTRKYLAVMVENTGVDFIDWSWHTNATANTIDQDARLNDRRVLEFQQRENGNFDAILISNLGSLAASWWWYFGQDAQSIQNLAVQNEARISDIDVYPDGKVTTFSAVMIENTNALTETRPAPVRMETYLEPNHPNPFNPRTTIRFSLAQPGHARLNIHDVRGRQLVSLLDADRAAGRHATVWDGRDDRGRELPSGIYIVRLSTATGSDSQKVTLVR